MRHECTAYLVYSKAVAMHLHTSMTRHDCTSAAPKCSVRIHFFALVPFAVTSIAASPPYAHGMSGCMWLAQGL